MKLFAVIGEKMGHSMSPFIHNAIFENLGLEDNYCIMQISRENLPNVITSAHILGYSGLNITMPYKEAIIPYLDNIADEVKAIGAVNTIRLENGIATGYNTDYFGFGSMLDRAHVHVTGKSIVLFGAGGAAKAIIAYLGASGAKSVHVVSKTQEKLEALQKRFPFITYGPLHSLENLEGDIAVNSTPVGMYPNVGHSVIPDTVIERFDALVDIVYNPLDTEFLLLGKKKGKAVVDGLYMLIDQAVKAQEIFQGIRIDMAVGETIYKTLSRKLNDNKTNSQSK